MLFLRIAVLFGLTCSLGLAQPPAATVHQADIRYASSIDKIPDLVAHIAWPADKQHVPLLVIMHGFRMQANSFKPETYARLGASTFVIGVELRGRGGSGGHPDAGGREIYDILDAVRTVLQHYPKETDPTQIHIVGYSGGGANALACASRFPDTFNTVTSFFGIADYAEWYEQAAPDQRRALSEWAGGAPQDRAASYASRSPLAAITNYTGGYLRLYHDRADTNVPAVHSDQIAAAMKAAGLHNFAIHISERTDSVRWLHQAPNGDSPDIQAEKEWLSDVTGKRYPAWTVPSSGSLQVLGYLETKAFAIWLGDGTQESSALHYNFASRTFSINAASSWRLVLKGQAPGAKVQATINDVAYHATAGSDGNAIFSQNK